MAYTPQKIHPLHPSPLPGPATIVTIVDMKEDGMVFVDFEGNVSGPILVRLLAGALSQANREDLIGAQALLVWPDSDSKMDTLYHPILVDVVLDRLPKPPCDTESTLTGPTVVHLDGDTLLLEGRREIQFRCGKASVVLQADGRIVIKGGDIVSRASRTHKIKGGSVDIN